MFEVLQVWQRGHWLMLQSRQENRRVVRAYITWQLRRSQLIWYRPFRPYKIQTLSIKGMVCYVHWRKTDRYFCFSTSKIEMLGSGVSHSQRSGHSAWAHMENFPTKISARDLDKRVKGRSLKEPFIRFCAKILTWLNPTTKCCRTWLRTHWEFSRYESLSAYLLISGFVLGFLEIQIVWRSDFYSESIYLAVSNIKLALLKLWGARPEVFLGLKHLHNLL